MTGDVGETFNAYKAERKQKRAANREKGHQTLERLGIDHEWKNLGAHLIVRHDGKVIDYWPGTGKWKVRGSDYVSRGIKNLLKHIGVD